MTRLIIALVTIIFLTSCGDDSSSNTNLTNKIDLPASSTIDLFSSSSDVSKMICDSVGTCFKSPLETCSKRPYNSECVKSCDAYYSCENDYICASEWRDNSIFFDVCLQACFDFKDSLINGNLYCFDLLRYGNTGHYLDEICNSTSNYCSYDWKIEPCTNENCMKDTRDGQIYKITTIGKQTWMAQNLNYRGYIFPTAMRDSLSYCYNDSCLKYGRYYTWAAAMDSAAIFSTGGKNCGYFSYDTICKPKYPVQGICPYGWHLPTIEEWRLLVTTVGGEDVAGQILGATTGWWLNNEKNKNSVNFDIFPTGYADFVGSTINFIDLGYGGKLGVLGVGKSAKFWSSSYHNPSTINGVSDHKIFGAEGLYYSPEYVNTTNGVGFVSFARSVRCVKD
ncbi:putative lipoprotein [Fibrobacter succinogenes subsp. succinogenes S85]|uniref:Putative lipoprotein n=1 Tax=Fibrobacter succinogenes (strain ATCC 19169 / S85) TaxID=59374 RepID=C9RP52_FIBSS|nr:hypothetical protein Fisuc_2940 [Fibrobacter succinogenes subsp. succinogenes S85]ADL24586.1 putative lipoprotein [Fibrobacter succinogenes subsp. succinogenes S85]